MKSNYILVFFIWSSLFNLFLFVVLGISCYSISCFAWVSSTWGIWKFSFYTLHLLFTFMEASETKWFNFILNIFGVNSLGLGGLHIVTYKLSILYNRVSFGVEFFLHDFKKIITNEQQIKRIKTFNSFFLFVKINKIMMHNIYHRFV